MENKEFKMFYYIVFAEEAGTVPSPAKQSEFHRKVSMDIYRRKWSVVDNMRRKEHFSRASIDLRRWEVPG